MLKLDQNIFKVMTDPRGFMKSLPKEKIGKMPLSLAWVIGMVVLFREAAAFQLSFYFPYWVVLLAAVIFAIPFGYLVNYVFSIFVYWSGKVFKGKGTFKELFSAVAYGCVPKVFILLAWLLMVIVIGQAVFTQAYILMGLPQLITILLFVQIIFYIWEFVITLHTIGETQGFSAWMSLWNLIFAGLLFFIIDLIIGVIIASIWGFDMSNSSNVSTLMSIIT